MIKGKTVFITGGANKHFSNRVLRATLVLMEVTRDVPPFSVYAGSPARIAHNRKAQ